MPKIFADTNEAVKRKILDCADGSSKLTLSLVTQMVKNLTAMQETWILYLGQEDSLDKGMRSLTGLSPWGCKESGMIEQITLSFFSLS